MAQNFEEMKQKTICPECGSKEMGLGYTYGDGSMHSKTTVLGMKAFVQASNVVTIVCKNCGLLVKSYAETPSKL